MSIELLTTALQYAPLEKRISLRMLLRYVTFHCRHRNNLPSSDVDCADINLSQLEFHNILPVGDDVHELHCPPVTHKCKNITSQEDDLSTIQRENTA